MAEEGAAQPQEAPQAMDDFSATMGRNLGEATPEPQEATPEADSTPAFDWNTVNLETTDVNTVPQEHRPAFEAAQRRVREMSSGVGQKMSQITQYENDIKALREEMETLKNPPPPAYEPGNVDVVAEKLGYDLSTATPQARDSFSVVNNIIEKHPIVDELKAAISEIREQLGPAATFVQNAMDKDMTAEYNAAVEAYGKDVVDTHLDAANALRGVTLPDGTTFDLHTAIGRVSGRAAAEADAITAQSKKAKTDAVGAAAAVTTVPGAEAEMSNAEIDKQIHKLLS
jgi:hypothetical protein